MYRSVRRKRYNYTKASRIYFRNVNIGTNYAFLMNGSSVCLHMNHKYGPFVDL